MYVCEVQGSDETGTGIESLPFKTAVKVLEFINGNEENVSILVRKSMEEGFQDISGAGLKKARKVYETNQRKAAKAAERAVADAEKSEKEAADEANRIENAKSIVLTQDASLPVAQKVLRGEEEG